MKKHSYYLAGLLLAGIPLLLRAEPAAAPKFLYDANPVHSVSELVRVHESFTVTPRPEGGIDVKAAPTKDGYPGLSFVPAKGEKTWDFSPWGHVEAKLTNLGGKPLSLSLRVDNNGNWKDSPWNCENLYLKPGESKVLKVFFGYQYGYQAGYQLDPGAVSQVLLFLNGKSAEERSFRMEDLMVAGASGEKPDSHQNAAYKAHSGMLLGAGANERPKLDAVGAVAHYQAQDAVAVSFEKSDGRLSLRPVAEKPDIWNLRNFHQVDAVVRNEGQEPAELTVSVESPAGPTDSEKATLKPGEKTVVSVSFLPKKPFKIVRTEGGKHQTEKGSGTRFESNRARSVTFRAASGTKLTVLSVRASAPAGVFPEWLGKRPPVPGTWKQTFAEEFDGAEIDFYRWNIYTANFWDRRTHFSKDNVLLKDGKAILRYERKEGFHNDDPEDKSPVAKTGFACGFLDTYGKWTQLYGYFEARMKLPRAMGLWPAFWTMPDRGGDRDPKANPQWKRASTGDGGMEFDILEHLTAWGPYRFNSAFHWDGYGKNHKATGTSQMYCTADKEGYVTIGMLWLPGSIAYYVNGQLMLSWEDERICSVPSYPIVYMVSGGWANQPLDLAALPSDFEIDYLRIWQREDLIRPEDGPQPNDGKPRAQY